LASGMFLRSANGSRAVKRPKDVRPGNPHRTWFWLGTTAVAIIAVIARWSLQLEQRSFNTLRHAYELIISTDELLSSLGDVEDGAFGYVSTGNLSYRNLYETSRETVQREMDQMSRLVRDDPQQRSRLERLRPLIDRKLNDVSQSVRRRDREEPSAVAPAVSERSPHAMQGIRGVIDEMKNDEHSALDHFSKSSAARQETGLAALMVSSLLATCCLLLGQTILSRNISRRRLAEEGLAVSEKRFETLCEQAPLGIYETDAQGFCIYTNPRWTEMSGLSAAESLGHGWTQALNPDDRATVFKDWQKAVLRGAAWEYRLTTARGEQRWIRALGGPIYSSSGDLTGYVGTLEDVTERRLAALALQDREALNRAVLNSLPANIAVLRSDGAIQSANDAWQRFGEKSASAPACFLDRGANYLEACKQAAAGGAAAAERAVQGIQKVLAGSLPSFEMQYTCHLGAGTKWFHLLVTPLSGVTTGGAVITHVDITRRKRAEERFRQVVEAAPSALVAADHEGKIRLVNSRAERLFGYRREELRWSPIQSLLLKAGREEPANSAKDTLASLKSAPASGENYAIRKDGTQVPVEVEVNSIETEEGIWQLSSIVDITERRNADRSLRESRQELRALAGRLINAQEEERRRISRQLHDDLSQKLALLAFDASDLVLSSPPSQNGLREGLRNLQIRVVQLSQDVRQIAHQLHPAILEDLGLIAALNELCEEFSAREGIKAVCEAGKIPGTVPKTIASCLYGVAQEALHNIMKHARASQVFVRVNATPPGICLSVQDNGVGFDETAARSMHGLGIISMKERVRLVEGEFSIHFQPGQGTEVTVAVPLSKEES
jgi:PAS domain S-box-containing protein